MDKMIRDITRTGSSWEYTTIPAQHIRPEPRVCRIHGDGIGDFYTVCQHMYDKIRERYVRASITQAAIRDGVAAANSYRT